MRSHLTLAAALVSLVAPACSHAPPDSRPASGEGAEALVTASLRAEPRTRAKPRPSASAPAKREPASSAPARDPRVLETLVDLGGDAVHRSRLRGGGVVQLNSSCGEWGWFTDGVAVFDPTAARPKLRRFEAGPFVELLDDRLLIEEQRWIGSDGGAAPLAFPDGSAGAVSTATGAFYVSRVTLIAADGTRRDAGWDSFSPIVAGGSQRFVVVGRDRWGTAPGEARRAETVELWDLQSGDLRVLARPDLPLRARAGSRELLVQISEDRALAVDGGDGSVREVELDAPLRPYVLGVPRVDEPIGLEPLWRDGEGREIFVLDGNDEPVAPRAGMCGVPTPLLIGGLLFTDAGVHAWPQGVGFFSSASSPGAGRPRRHP